VCVCARARARCVRAPLTACEWMRACTVFSITVSLLEISVNCIYFVFAAISGLALLAGILQYREVHSSTCVVCSLTLSYYYLCQIFLRDFSLPIFLRSPPLSLLLWDTQTLGQPLLVQADDLKMELQSLKALPWSERYFPIISKLAGHKSQDSKYDPLVVQHSTHYGAFETAADSSQGASLGSPREDM
jgi:hypothetical protein